MKEEYKPYLASILIGIIAGAVVGSFCHIMPIKFIMSVKFNLLVSVIPPIAVLFLSFILSKAFPFAWKEIRTRVFCIVLLLVIYIYIVPFTVIIIGGILSDLYKVPLMPFYAIFFGMIWNPSAYVYYFTIVAITAAYVATSGIKNLPKRIILALTLAFFIYIIAISPLVMISGSA